MSTNFTSEQAAVVAHNKGHALVSAVAGSGKTEVLVARTNRLLTEGYDADRMLILMFNKSAQEVFLERLASSFPEGTSLPAVLTFHALGLQVLQIWYDRKYMPPPQIVEDNAYWLDLAKRAVEECNQEGGYGMSSHPDQLRKYLAGLDLIKNLDYPQESLDPGEYGWTQLFCDNVRAIFDKFEAIRRSERAHGLNDLLYDAVALLREQPEYADEWRDSLDDILVDEYQDSNRLQQWLLERFTHANTSVMAVGDEDQCIYTWRGANPEFMVRGFEATFPKAVRYTLSRTFRYGHAVALMANHVLQHNVIRPDKLVVSGLNKTGQVEVVPATTAMDMASVWTSLTENDAILVRAFRHADDIEWAFRLANLPYRLEGADLFPSRPSGQVLRVAIGCAREKNHKPALNDVKAWIRWVDRECSSSWVDMLANIFADVGIDQGIRKAQQWRQINTKQNSHLVQMQVWSGRLFMSGSQPEPVAAIGRRLQDAWARNRDEKFDPPPLPGFVPILRDHSAGWTLDELTERLENWTEHDTGPLITSVHRSKGGGWPTVVLPHVEDTAFPAEEGSEEERRLFYVAITRAKERLVLGVPADPDRDMLWEMPTQATMGIANFKGPSSKFVVEALPLYAQRIGEMLLTGATKGEPLTPMARRYEQSLYPNVVKSKGMWGALVK